jgi:PAS domain S-box-containing protein
VVIIHSSDNDETLKLYGSIFNKSLDAVFITLKDSRVDEIYYANHAAEQLFGYNLDELYKLSWDGIVDKKDPKLLKFLKELSQNGNALGEINFIKKDGTVFPGEISANLIDKTNMNISVIKDIKWRKDAENALLESEKKFKYRAYLLNQVNDAVFGLDNNFRITYWNKGAENLFGYTEDEAVGNNSLELLSPMSKPSERETIINELKVKGSFNSTIITQNKKGSEIIVEQHSSRILLDQGIEGYIVVYRDITKRKIVEDNLKLSEERYRSIIDNIQDGFFRLNNEGKIIMASPSLADIYGLDSVDQIVGQSVIPLFKNTKDNKLLTNKLIKHGKLENIEVEGLKFDGTPFWLSLNAQFYFDDKNQVPVVDGFVRDINTRKTAEDALKKSQERYKEILGNIQDSYLRADKNGKVVMANVAAAETYRYNSPKEMIGKNATAFYKNPDEREEVLEKLNTYGKIENNEIEGLRKDGTTFIASQNAQFYYDDKGEVQGIETLVRDITEKKQAEIEIEEGLKKLEQSNKELEQFAYITSHDLREPLRMITSFLQLLKRRYKDKLDKDANEFIDFAVEGAKRLDTMTNDLLQYSQLNSQKRKISPVNFENVLNETLANLKVPIEENKAVITHDPLPTIYGDEKLKVQLFQNIIGNALKYRSKSTPHIHISAKKEKNQYLFSISDNGIGMSKDHLNKIFTIFQRLHTRAEYEGTGIGLAISKKIVEQQDGHIWVESVVGKGTTFYFTIPIK